MCILMIILVALFMIILLMSLSPSKDNYVPWVRLGDSKDNKTVDLNTLDNNLADCLNYNSPEGRAGINHCLAEYKFGQGFPLEERIYSLE